MFCLFQWAVTFKCFIVISMHLEVGQGTDSVNFFHCFEVLVVDFFYVLFLKIFFLYLSFSITL